MSKYIYYLTILIFLAPPLVYSQQLDSMLNIYATNYPQEKIHIQLDKSIYRAGETIWFKAYIFAGSEPSTLSRNFYAELMDASGMVMQRKVYPITESSSVGSFDLPENISGRRLHLRAYTTWMTNFDTAFYFEKDIRLYNPGKDPTGMPAPVRRVAAIQFFPEGGDLVAGVENMIAFKANDQFGQPVTVKGVIRNGSGKDLQTFESVHDGMGEFLLTPDEDDSLTAVWTNEQGIEHRSGLPALRAKGVALRVIPGNQKISFFLTRSAEDAPELHRVTIIAHMHQQQVYKADIDLHDDEISRRTISTAGLPSGVLTLTVFNANMAPVAERVVFINNHQYLFQPQLSVATQSVTRRSKNTLTIDLPDTLRANLSLAVTDATADGGHPDDDNIVSRLLLTGEIRGYVHDPYFYFAGDADSLINLLDLVMLTHGWRRIKWDELVRGQVPVIRNPEQDYLALTGDVGGVNPGKIASNESLTVIVNGRRSNSRTIMLPYLGGGHFGSVSGLVFFDTARVFYKFSVNHGLADQAVVNFNNGLIKGAMMVAPSSAAFEGWAADDTSYLRRNKYIAQAAARVETSDMEQVKTLTSATVRGHVQTAVQALNEKYASGAFAGAEAYTFDVVDDPSAPTWENIFHYLQGRVPGMSIVQNMDIFTAIIKATKNLNGGSDTMWVAKWRDQPAALYLDEQRVNPDILENLSVSDIALVKVFPPGFAGVIGDGKKSAIAVYTRRGGDASPPDPNQTVQHRAMVVGYAAPKEFYSPNYDEPSPADKNEDLRTTLYWQPFILTGKDKRQVTINFFNNDISKKLRIVLEGFDEDGKLTHIERIIQ